MYLPEYSLTQPSMLTANHKPVLPVVLDGSPMSAMWEIVSVLDGKRDTNLVTGTSLVYSGTTRNVSFCRGGRGLKFLHTSNTKLVLKDVGPDGTFSVVIRGVYDASHTINTLVTGSEAIDSATPQLRVSSGALQLLSQNTSLISGPTHDALSTGKPFTAGLVYADNSYYALYLNGAMLSSGTAPNLTTGNICLGHRNGATTEAWSGTGLFVAMATSVIPDAVMKAMTANPYQILRPITHLYLAYSAAAPGLSVDQIIAMRRKPNTPLIAM